MLLCDTARPMQSGVAPRLDRCPGDRMVAAACSLDERGNCIGFIFRASRLSGRAPATTMR